MERHRVRAAYSEVGEAVRSFFCIYKVQHATKDKDALGQLKYNHVMAGVGRNRGHGGVSLTWKGVGEVSGVVRGVIGPAPRGS
jgi:hypothetical protein